MDKLLILFCIFVHFSHIECAWQFGYKNGIFAWKQIGFEIAGVHYENSTVKEYNPDAIHFPTSGEELEDSEKFFIQPNNVPIGLEVYGDRVFITVPRRRYGIPSTLNYITLPPQKGFSSSAPLLQPYPGPETSSRLVSVYRPRVDACGRLWVLDTGHLEVPGVRKQIKPPSIIIFDLKSDKEILNQELDSSIIVNERTSAGLTSITVDVDPKACGDAFAYINDLATEGLVVFSLKTRKSWRLDHPSFRHDEKAMNFTVTGHLLNWRDGLFSVALSNTEKNGSRTAFFHSMVSTEEYAVDTAVLKNRTASIEGHIKLVGNRGPLSQSGSHDFHPASGVFFFANLPQDAIACWNLETPLTPQNVVVSVSDPRELGYISDLKVSGDDVWVLVNGIPKFVYNTQDISEVNYYIRRYPVKQLIEGTICDARNLYPME